MLHYSQLSSDSMLFMTLAESLYSYNLVYASSNTEKFRETIKSSLCSFSFSLTNSFRCRHDIVILNAKN